MDCHPASSLTCQDLAQSFEQWHGGATIAFPLQLLPALIGAFAGAPILAREMETGTFRYAWTQGFGRTRWIIAKLALVGGPLAVIAGAFGILTYWYFGPFVAEGQLIPLDPRTFDLECLAFPGWVLAAFTIGAFAGVLIRRVVPRWPRRWRSSAASASRPACTCASTTCRRWLSLASTAPRRPPRR